MDVFNVNGSYYSEMSNQNLYALEVDEKYEGRGEKKQKVAAMKKSEFIFRPSKKQSFDDAKKEPYEIPTSHPILKGRLK